MIFPNMVKKKDLDKVHLKKDGQNLKFTVRKIVPVFERGKNKEILSTKFPSCMVQRDSFQSKWL